MKFAKMLFASLAVFALSLALSSNASAQTSVDNQLAWTGGDGSGDFVIATGTKSRLNNSANWGSFAAWTGTCGGSGKICKARIQYTYTAPGETDPNPTIQQVINAIHAAYNDGVTPHVFNTPITFTVPGNSVVITVTIDEKN